MTAIAALVSGCSTIEPYSPPEAALPASFSQGGGGSAGETATVQWWRSFNDSRLNRLVDQGLSQNLDIRIAGERYRAAEAVARGAGIAVAGGLNAEAGARGGSDVVEEGFTTGTANVSWLLDFTGRLTGERNVAAAGLEAAGYNVESARLAYLSQLSEAYVNARYFQNRMAAIRRNIGSRQTTLDLTQRLADADLATVVDLVQARSLVEEARADLPGLEAQFLISSHRISTLLGQPAGAMVPYLSAGAPQPVPSRVYASGVPADLLRNRPDVRAAERTLAAAVARIGIARSDLYPSISLVGRITGRAGTESNNVSTWAFGPIVNLPIFGREALNATVSQREAEARAQLLVWQNTVLVAVEEVENALASVSRSRRTVAAEQRSVNILQESLDLQREAFERGERSILAVIDAEQRVGDARLRLSDAQRRHAVNFIALNVAIGSGRGLGAPVAAPDSGS